MAKSNYHSGKKRDHCYFCGAFGNLEEHHVIPQRFGGPDDASNIVELCGQCHDRLERLYDAAFYGYFGVEDETGRREFHRPCVIGDCTETAEVKLRLPGFGETAFYCTDCAIDMGEVWADSSQDPVEVVENQAVEYADSCPLKEAV